ncbi:hypothetical protein [Agromyces arachidis]|uniref:hypothetical protein n=1 Tax=Agromyces arachidis TaxID=766966 RepID=UPI0040566DFD
MAGGHAASARPITVVVDVANVMGSRPDGWWRDRAAAATRLLERMPRLDGAAMELDGESVTVARVVAVVEGRAREATAPVGVEVVAAPADGDSAIVEAAVDAVGRGERVLVVTADRGLRARLPAAVAAVGPDRVNAIIGR